jgi:hypothetical protein
MSENEKEMWRYTDKEMVLIREALIQQSFDLREQKIDMGFSHAVIGIGKDRITDDIDGMYNRSIRCLAKINRTIKQRK